MIRSVALVMLLSTSTALAALGQEPVTWSVVARPHSVLAGGSAVVRITAAIQEGWHVYAITQGPGGPAPLRIALLPGVMELAGTVVQSRPDSAFDANFGMAVQQFTRQATFDMPARAKKGNAAGSHRLAVDVRYQVCNESLCLPPQTEHLTAQVSIASRRAR